MGSVKISKHITLGHFLWVVDDEAVFRYGDDDNNPHFHYLNAESWEDMGRPATIMVGTEPFSG
jgi:hypothetical protein